MTDEVAMQEVITLLALTQDVLLDIVIESKEMDEIVLGIYCNALAKLGNLLEETIEAIATYYRLYYEKRIGCEGTD